MPKFTLIQIGQQSEIDIPVSTAIVAGWTGRYAGALAQHINELEQLGVAPPDAIPTYYRVSASRLTQAGEIQVSGGQSTGEAECLLVRHQGTLYVGIGSDHTDRQVETYSITVSKQMCDKPVAATLWPFDEVRSHWDSLVMRSWIGSGEELYQEGGVDHLLHPLETLAEYERRNGPVGDGTLMFCGTLNAIGGVRPSTHFRFELHDPVLGRAIRHAYDLAELPMAG